MNNKIIIYTFKDYAPNIYSDEKGDFFDIKFDIPIPKKVYNGCLCINYKGKRYGFAKLRKNAEKSFKVIEECPF